MKIIAQNAKCLAISEEGNQKPGESIADTCRIEISDDGKQVLFGSSYSKEELDQFFA